MNAFDKHKDYLRKTKKQTEIDINALKDAIKILKLFLYRNSDTKDFQIALNEIKMKCKSDIPEVVEKLKKLETKEDISQLIKILEKYANNYAAEIKIINTIITSLGSEQVINIIPDFYI